MPPIFVDYLCREDVRVLPGAPSTWSTDPELWNVDTHDRLDDQACDLFLRRPGA